MACQIEELNEYMYGLFEENDGRSMNVIAYKDLVMSVNKLMEVRGKDVRIEEKLGLEYNHASENGNEVSPVVLDSKDNDDMSEFESMDLTEEQKDIIAKALNCKK